LMFIWSGPEAAYRVAAQQQAHLNDQPAHGTVRAI